MRRKYSFLILFTLSLSAFFVDSDGQAESLSEPEGRPVLYVEGKITNTNNDGKAVFDRQQLAALPQTILTVETPWTDGLVNFEGPLLSDMLDLVGAEGISIKAKALNDYAITIPIEDVKNYPIILAIKKDSKELSVRDKGPIWVIYPWSDYGELCVEIYYSRSIWQLKTLTIQ